MQVGKILCANYNGHVTKCGVFVNHLSESVLTLDCIGHCGYYARLLTLGQPCASVAQLDRVGGFEPLGRGFESLRVRQILKKPAFGGFFNIIKPVCLFFASPLYPLNIKIAVLGQLWFANILRAAPKFPSSMFRRRGNYYPVGITLMQAKIHNTNHSIRTPF